MKAKGEGIENAPSTWFAPQRRKITIKLERVFKAGERTKAV
jgi:hypothetical protein